MDLSNLISESLPEGCEVTIVDPRLRRIILVTSGAIILGPGASNDERTGFNDLISSIILATQSDSGAGLRFDVEVAQNQL